MPRQLPPSLGFGSLGRAHKKGGVVLSAYHATQGRRIVQTSIITSKHPAGSRVEKDFSPFSRPLSVVLGGQ
jgi:hypothetical protein